VDGGVGFDDFESLKQLQRIFYGLFQKINVSINEEVGVRDKSISPHVAASGPIKELTVRNENVMVGT
jgi:hypothetical protein